MRKKGVRFAPLGIPESIGPQANFGRRGAELAWEAFLDFFLNMQVLSHPACVDSIPTSANKEDHVSMGTISARKCRDIVESAEAVVAIELLCAAQALDLFTNMKPGEGTLAAYETIRREVAPMEKDRVLSTDIERVAGLIRSGLLVRNVENAVGGLH
jgi:histidine ammonia-lyase